MTFYIEDQVILPDGTKARITDQRTITQYRAAEDSRWYNRDEIKAPPRYEIGDKVSLDANNLYSDTLKGIIVGETLSNYTSTPCAQVTVIGNGEPRIQGWAYSRTTAGWAE